ncbi:MAG: Hint domain-containing protein, partial [Pseudomonadota bacterium]
AFRFGHTLVASQLERVEDDGTVSEAGHQGLMDAFFDPGGVREGGLDDYLRGMAQQSAQDLDTKVVDALNFFLATPDGVSGFSLPALNLLRSADHGMDSYVNVRAQLLGDIDPAALDPSNFSIITADTDLQAELASVYGTVHDVDLWVGGLAEDQVEGTMLGPLFGHIVSDQFVRTATADETFGTLDPALGLQIIADARASDLQHIILRNTNIDHLQDNPFLMETRSLTEVMTIQGSPQNDAVDIAALEVETTVITRSGDDSVIVTSGSRLQDGVNLGGGDDRFEMSSGSVDGGVSGGSGADAVGLDGTARADQLRGGAGNDTIRLDEVAAAQAIKGQAGHDAIHLMGKAAAGAITGNAGDDRIELSDTASASVIRGGRGDDSVWVADGAHAGDIHLGTGDDLTRLDGPGTHQVDGGKGTDVLQVGAGAKVMFDGDTDGTITWADGDKTTFRNFEVVTCFTPGTLIVTAAGKRPIETLKSGARVLTLDHGLQPIRWVGRTKVPAQGRLAPIRIDAQALGNTRRLDVSPQHRMLLTSAHAEMLFGATDMLAPALALIDRDGVARCEGGEVDYIHLLFDRHEIIFAEGIPSESFHPGLVALSALDRAARDEIQRLFPDLPRDGYGADARPALRGREARLLARLLA